MAKFVFKLKGLGVELPIVRTYNVADAAVLRALDKLRKLGEDGPPETNEEIMVRLWTAFMEEHVVEKDYASRKNVALAAAAVGITKVVPTVDALET